MQNTTRLLERHVDQLADNRVLVVDADDSALASLVGAAGVVHADRADVRASQYAPMPMLAADTSLLVVILPKSRERLAWLLEGLARQLSAPMNCWLVGPGKGGIRGALKLFAEYTDLVEQLDSARHCKLFAARLQPRSGATELTCDPVWQWQGLRICSLPGVFAHGRLDEGSELLLSAMDQSALAGSVLDMGCGSGILSARLASLGCRVTACDVSATAVAATKATLAANGLEGKVFHSDLFAAVAGQTFDLICTNPPFHAGIEQTTLISRRLISSARGHLRPGGQLLLVANQGLPYGDWLHEAFSRVEMVLENRRFRVWRAA